MANENISPVTFGDAAADGDSVDGDTPYFLNLKLLILFLCLILIELPC